MIAPYRLEKQLPLVCVMAEVPRRDVRAAAFLVPLMSAGKKPCGSSWQSRGVNAVRNQNHPCYCQETNDGSHWIKWMLFQGEKHLILKKIPFLNFMGMAFHRKLKKLKLIICSFEAARSVTSSDIRSVSINSSDSWRSDRWRGRLHSNLDKRNLQFLDCWPIL